MPIQILWGNDLNAQNTFIQKLIDNEVSKEWKEINVTNLNGDDDESKWLQSKQLVHYYINRMGTFYWEALIRNGFEEEVQASREAWEARDVDKSINAITNEMIESMQVIGTIEEIRDKFIERSDLGADLQLIQMPAGDLEYTEKILKTLLN